MKAQSKERIGEIVKSDIIQLFALLHFHSHCLLKGLPEEEIDKRMTWKRLINNINERDDKTDLQMVLKLTNIWIKYLGNSSLSLLRFFEIAHPPSFDQSKKVNTPFIKYRNSLVSPGMVSMWRHCKKRFEYNHDGWRVDVQSAHMSRAYQFFLFSRYSPALLEVIEKFPPPGYGNYQASFPNIRISLESETDPIKSKPWQSLYESCSEFGFKPAFPFHQKLKNELTFPGIENLYEAIFANPLIPKNIARDLPIALRTTSFYPSPEGLRIILALSAQESTIQWNPKLNKQKKKLLKRRFDNLLTNINNSVPGSVTQFFLSQNHQSKLEELIAELEYLTDPKQEKSREYDFYTWSRKALSFVEELTETYNQIAKIGNWLFNIQALSDRLSKEPQTFGLWQINVNHLLEKIDTFKQLRRAFPELYQMSNGKWNVNRSWLIDALSGKPNARLTRKRTLELIIHTHLKPRYTNHLLGDQKDLMYFSAENMSGEMSTFRAAIQKALNSKMRSALVTDGDLTYYLPYSTRINWSKTSKTTLVLEEFIKKHRYYFSEPVDQKKLIFDLCQAKNWNDLRSLELYQKLIDKHTAARVFPDIRSNLYNQSPFGYAKQVMRKSQLF